MNASPLPAMFLAYVLCEFLPADSPAAGPARRWLRLGLRWLRYFAALLAVAAPFFASASQTRLLVLAALGVSLAHCLVGAVARFARRVRPARDALPIFLAAEGLNVALLVVVAAVFLPAMALSPPAEAALRGVAASLPAAPLPQAIHQAIWLIVVIIAVIWGGDRFAQSSVADLQPPEPVARLSPRIGVFERLLCVSFAYAQEWSAIGLVLTAKSIARFKDLEQPQVAQYYLVGTLASVGWAVAAGKILHWLLQMS